MKIEIGIKTDYINIALDNDGSDTLRIWEFTNSWGWSVLSLTIRTSGLDKQYILTRRKSMIWTINFPAFVIVKPESKFEIQIYPDSNWWEFEQDLSVLKDRQFMVKAVLDIPESPEAKEFGVFVGRVESAWVESTPPHRWLFQKD